MDGPQQREYGDDVRPDSLSTDLDDLQKECAALDEALELLDRKAHPLLTPAPEATSADAATTEAAYDPVSEIRQRVQSSIRRIRRVRTELAYLTRRLEV